MLQAGGELLLMHHLKVLESCIYVHVSKIEVLIPPPVLTSGGV